jgi:hypothetical protein
MGTHRTLTISAIAALALAGFGAVGPAAHAGPFLVGSSIYDNLSRLVNRPVTLMLKGGGQAQGIVREIGTKLVRLEGPSGEQSLVVVDEIAVLNTEPAHP